MKAMLASAILALMGASGAAAADYRFVNISDDQIDFIDASSLNTMPDGTKRVWTVSVLRKPLPDTPLKVAYLIVRQDFDCANERDRVSFFGLYDKAGAQIAERDTIQPWGTSIPGSHGRDTFDAACKELPTGRSREFVSDIMKDFASLIEMGD